VIAIDNILVSDDIVEAKFICDLHKCKGGCCEDGDAGAPLEKAELKELEAHINVIKPYLTPEGLQELKRQGLYTYDREFGFVTPTVNSGICAYAFRDNQGIIKCGIEAAYRDGKLDWKKPISCHLYPIKVNKTKTYTMLNYEPRDPMCNPGCALGKKAKMPVYEFLKEPLERKFGTEFYTTLHQIAVEHFSEKEKTR
jgi:hypothetical protein